MWKIGYITNSFAQKDGYGYNILNGLEKIACNKGYRLEVANSNYDFEKEKEIVAKMVNNNMDGIILYPVPRKDSNSEYLANNFTDVPIVLVDLAKPEMQRPSVIFDNYNAGYEMAKYLIGKNKKKIIFMHNLLESTNRSVQDRVLGCRRAIEDDINAGSDIEFSIKMWKGNSLKCLRSELEFLLSSSNHPDAIISSYDKEAAIVFFWLTANGFKVPSEVEVVGFDNIIPSFVPWLNWNEEYHYHWPTTNPDFTRLGERAAELLLEMIEKNCKINKEILLPCPLLVQRHNIHIKSFVGSSKDLLNTAAVPLQI